jgi:putative oxidoreductase
MREYGPTVLRVFLAMVFIAHGVEQLFGVWGGGLSGTVAALTRMHAPAAYPLAVGIAAGELACGILLLLGAFTAWATMALIAGEAATFYAAYAASGVFVPSARIARLEFELSLVLMGGLLSLLLTGSGALSLEGKRHRSAERAAAGRARIRSGKM